MKVRVTSQIRGQMYIQCKKLLNHAVISNCGSVKKYLYKSDSFILKKYKRNDNILASIYYINNCCPLLVLCILVYYYISIGHIIFAKTKEYTRYYVHNNRILIFKSICIHSPLCTIQTVIFSLMIGRSQI